MHCGDNSFRVNSVSDKHTLYTMPYPWGLLFIRVNCKNWWTVKALIPVYRACCQYLINVQRIVFLNTVLCTSVHVFTQHSSTAAMRLLCPRVMANCTRNSCVNHWLKNCFRTAIVLEHFCIIHVCCAFWWSCTVLMYRGFQRVSRAANYGDLIKEQLINCRNSTRSNIWATIAFGWNR